MPDFEFTGPTYDPSDPNWETEAFGTETTFGATGAVVPTEITDLLTDLLPSASEEERAGYLKYLEQYDETGEMFAGMQQQLSQAGAQTSWTAAQSQAEFYWALP